MAANPRKHYGLQSVRSSLKHFLLGKAFTVFSSLAVLLLLARSLSVPEFATLVLLQALANIVNILSSFGVNQTTLRYVPMLREENNNRPMYRLLFTSVVYRGVTVAGFLVAIWVLSPYLGGWLHLGDWSWLLPLYLVVAWLRLMSFFLQRLLESLLWQKASQYSLALASLLKLILVVWLIMTGQLGLYQVVLTELTAEAVGSGIVFLALVVGWRRDPDRDRGDPSWADRQRRRMFFYGLWGYLQMLASALYGSAANRIIVGRFLTVQDLGLFGFISALGDLGRRYLPTSMLQGMIRPLFFAKYASSKDFSALVDMGDFNFRISLILLVFPALLLSVAGVPIIDWLTADKYGEGAYLLVAIFGVLALESYRSQLELLVQSAEKNHLLLVGNLMLSVSILAALPLMHLLGLWAVVLANMLGNLLAVAWVIFALDRYGLKVGIAWAMTGRVLIPAALAGLLGWILAQWLQSVTLGSAVAILAFVGSLVWQPPFSASEKETMRRLLGSKLRGKSSPAPGHDDD